MENLVSLIIVVLLTALTLGLAYIIYTLYKNGFISGKIGNLTGGGSKVIISEAEATAEEIIQNAQKKAKRIVQESESLENALNEREKKLLSRSNELDNRFSDLEKKADTINSQKEQLRKERSTLTQKLEEIAGLSTAEAKAKIEEQVISELKNWEAKEVRQAEQNIKRDSEELAQEILIDAMQQSASDFVSDTTVTTFEIEDESVKGKIIGREGRNIKAFERLTGVDIIVDEAPNQISLSCFDPIRREIAALAIKKLLKDGRVQPAAIEETVKNIRKELLREIKKTGEKIAFETGFSDLPEEIIMLLGRFKYRFSYGQNLAKHSIEMVNIGGQIATALGADVRITKLACLLHDIGKVLTHEYEGKPHHHISGDIVRKYLKNEKVAHAVEAHHHDIEPETIEAWIVIVADKISGARPGARKSTYDDYVKRVSALEGIAKSYEQVDEAYALQAGREVRIMVKPEKTSDDDAKSLAYKIAKEIEDTQSYPGSVKVTVIREARFSGEAK